MDIEKSRDPALAEMRKLQEQIDATSNRWAERFVRSTGTTLVALGTRYGNAVAAMKAAQDRLKEIQSDSARLGADVTSKIVETGNVTTGPTGSMLYRLRAAVSNAREFGSDLRELQRRGLDSTTLRQLAEAGPAEGLRAAQELLAGGGGMIKSVSSLQGQLAAAAGSSGRQVSDAMYAAGAASVQGLISGLRSQEAVLDREIRRIAARMVSQTKAHLRIKSPSQVFADEVGRHVPAGIAAGVVQNAAVVDKAMAGLTSRAVRGGTDALEGFGSVRSPVVGRVPLQGRGSLPGRMTLEVVGTDQALVDLIRRLVRVRGGDVQLAFGGR